MVLNILKKSAFLPFFFLLVHTCAFAQVNNNVTVPGPTLPTNGDCASFAVSGGTVLLGDAGKACGGVSQRVVYASTVAGVVTNGSIAVGSAVTGTDNSAALNAVLSGGNIHLYMDFASAIAATNGLVLYSNTTITCTSPGYGFGSSASSNSTLLTNAHPNPATTASGTGGFLVSNITDTGITIEGCLLNSDSTHSTTGSSHQGNGTTYVYAVRFLGVNGLTFRDNEMYDSPTYSFAASNVENVTVAGNYIHQPVPIVTLKGTDGIHFNGPATNLRIVGNRINSGDDAIPLNADDVYQPGCTSNCAPGTEPTGWQWGPITQAYILDNIFENPMSGIRLLSGTERIDQIVIKDVTGAAVNNVLAIGPYSGGIGNGNVGTVNIDGIRVDNATGTDYNPGDSASSIWGALFNIDGNVEQLNVSHVQLDNPRSGGSFHHILKTTQSQGGMTGIQNLNLGDWAIYNPTGNQMTMLVQTGAPIGHLTADGITWVDASGGTGTFFGGTVDPGIMTLGSGMDIPGTSITDRLLASGYAPINMLGMGYMASAQGAIGIVSQMFFGGNTAGTVFNANIVSNGTNNSGLKITTSSNTAGSVLTLGPTGSTQWDLQGLGAAATQGAQWYNKFLLGTASATHMVADDSGNIALGGVQTDASGTGSVLNLGSAGGVKIVGIASALSCSATSGPEGSDGDGTMFYIKGSGSANGSLRMCSNQTGTYTIKTIF